MAKFTVFILATALCVGSALAACPKGANSGILPGGKPYCLYCADGSGIVENFGDMTCSCPGGKECLATIDGKDATFDDYVKATQVSSGTDLPEVVSSSEETTESSSSSSSSEETSSSSSSSTTTTSSPDPVSISEPVSVPEATPSSSSSQLRGVAVVLSGLAAAVMA